MLSFCSMKILLFPWLLLIPVKRMCWNWRGWIQNVSQFSSVSVLKCSVRAARVLSTYMSSLFLCFPYCGSRRTWKHQSVWILTFWWEIDCICGPKNFQVLMRHKSDITVLGSSLLTIWILGQVWPIPLSWLHSLLYFLKLHLDSIIWAIELWIVQNSTRHFW